MAWRPERATRCGTRSVRVLETLMNLVDELNTRTRLGRRKAPLGVIFFALTACGGALETELPAAPSSPPPPALRYEIRGADDDTPRMLGPAGSKKRFSRPFDAACSVCTQAAKPQRKKD